MTRRKPLRELLGRALSAGRSQAEIARSLGVSRSTVHLWASGKRQPPERYRAALRTLTRPGASVAAPPPRTTRSGAPVKTAGSATVTRLPSGAEHVHTHARSAFARELDRLHAAGRAPDSFTVMLHGFRSDLYRTKDDAGGARSRRIEVRGLTDTEIRGLAANRKDVLESVITRAIEARNYDGGFTFDRATAFNFDSAP